jgi:methyl-accepting chemotaxis protein
MLIVVGLTAVTGLNFAANTTATLNTNIIEQVKLNQLNESLRADLLTTVNGVAHGSISWEKGRAGLASANNLILNNWDEFKEDRPASEVKEIETSLGDDFQDVTNAIESLETLFQAEDIERLTLFVDEDMPGLINPFLIELNEKVNEQQLLSEGLFQESIQTNKTFLNNSIITVIIGLAIASILGYLIFRSISRPVRSISSTVAKVAEGDYYARTDVKGNDELGELGKAFDDLLEDKVATLVQIEKDNEQLNESVISLLQAVSKLSQRDLTIKVPVTEDVTGPVADALNQLTSETSRVLLGMRRISEEVAKASSKVKSQSDTVIAVASDEQRELEETTNDLAVAIETMNKIAEMAQDCNLVAENAIDTTETALDTVTNTVEGFGDIRNEIHETEKRIKRLGERSQEITRAINLINTISERTHILALNASMHAASAGEAGRGFAVVADEVQRLAENARDATAQISTLVSNIQVETSDTVSTMNNLITQVVEGSRLAEKAGDQMRETRETTNNLVDSVRQIASHSQDQARMSNKLQHHAQQMQESSSKTRQQMQEQSQMTVKLVQYAKGLLKAVQVFELPELQVVGGRNVSDETTDLVDKKAS